MPVRVKLRIRSETGRTVEIPALVNTGYSVEEPEILVPANIAESLDLKPELHEGTRIEEYHTVSGRVKLTYIPKGAGVSVSTEDRVVGPVRAHAVVSTIESEVLISDKLADELGISIIRAGAGEWRFTDDPQDKTRKSVPLYPKGSPTS